MTDTKHIPLRIEPVSGGGFVVSDAWHNDLGRLCGPLFACTTLDEALGFIRSRLAPAEPAKCCGAAIRCVDCGERSL